MFDFFITSALAADTAPISGSNGSFSGLIMLAVMIAVFYFLLIRPQSKRAKEHRKMLEALHTGDEVITSGGLLGRITNVLDDFISLKVADNVEVRVQKHAVANIVPKGTLQGESKSK